MPAAAAHQARATAMPSSLKELALSAGKKQAVSVTWRRGRAAR